jgi:hypothetical protein
MEKGFATGPFGETLMKEAKINGRINIKDTAIRKNKYFPRKTAMLLILFFVF